MPINANIPLSGRPANIGGLALQFADNMQRQKRQEKQDAKQDEVLDLQRQRFQAETARAGKLQSSQEAAELAVRLKANPDGALDVLQRHRARLSRRMAGDPTVNTTQTDEMIEQLESDPDGFWRNVEGEYQVGANMGLIKPAQAGERFEPITDDKGNIIGQRSTKTGKVVSDPRAPEKASPLAQGLQALAASNAQATLEGRRLQNEERREARADRKQARQEEKLGKLRRANDALVVASEQVKDIRSEIERAKTLAQSWGATGTAGAILANAASNDAVDLRETLKGILANSTLNTLQQAKAEGVTFGALSDSELMLTGARRGSLNPNQSPEQLISNLDRIAKHYDRVERNAGRELKRVRGDLGISDEAEMTDEEQVVRQGVEGELSGLSPGDAADLKRLRKKYGQR